MKTIAVVTGTRAEYGILYPLIKKLDATSSFDLKIFVTGMHLSPEFGLTYKDISNDGFVIHEKIDMLLSSDTDTGITKSIGLGMIGFSDCFSRHDLDLLIVLGDRYETYSAVVAAYIAKIPIVHLHGGELTEGLIDEGLRHSITKMSAIHFASTEVYKNRIIQLGEQPENVFNVGALGVENIKYVVPVSKSELEKDLDFIIDEKTFVVTYHPVTLGADTAGDEITTLLNTLGQMKALKLIFTMPNADTNGRIIIKKINDFVSANQERCLSITSLGRKRYLSVMNYIGGVIGNSSSGLIEVPSFGIPTINIGQRQRGRVAPKSVIQCEMNNQSLIEAINKSLNSEFRKSCKLYSNPYSGEETSDQMIKLLTDLELSEKLIKKTFYDIKR